MPTKHIVDLSKGNWKPIPIEIIRSDLTDREFRVWCHIFAYDRDNGKVNSRSVPTMTKDLGSGCTKQLHRIVASLEQKGFLLIVKRKGTTSIYFPLNPYLQAQTVDKSSRRYQKSTNIYKKGKMKFGARIVTKGEIDTFIQTFCDKHNAITNTLYLTTEQDRVAVHDALSLCPLDLAILHLETIFRGVTSKTRLSLVDICSTIERHFTKTRETG